LLIVSTLLRLFQLSALELAPDEAYYWDWSRRLAWGYYDQGPMIAYLIRATTALFGTNEFGVRLGVLIASAGTLFCCYLLARRLTAPLVGFLVVALLALTPLMAVGSTIATYDPLLVFFWALALVCLERALFGDTEHVQSLGWLATGVATGLGFLSKHTMLLLLPCTLLFLTLSPPHRRWLRRPEPYLAFVLTLLLYTGVFWWNIHNHWWTFRHLLFLSAKTPGTPLWRCGDFLGSQALLLGPVLFVGALAACWRTLRPGPKLQIEPPAALETQRHRGNAEEGSPNAQRLTPNASSLDSRLLFLVCMGLPVFVFFLLLTLKAKVQGNWAPCAWLTPTILWSAWLTAALGRSRQAARKTLGLIALTLCTGGLLTAVILFPGLRLRLGVHLPPAADLSNTAYGWRQVAARVEQVRQEMAQGGHRKVFVAGNGYQYAALMAFYLPDHPETYDLFLHFRLTMYAAHVERLKQLLGQDAIFVNDGEADDADLRQIFTQVKWEPPLLIWRRPLYAQPVHSLHIARCYGYRRYVGLDWARGG
jgi:4-amino-4-deoxy-L-arabinose transferase-like glycosyltransferase